MMQLNFYNVQHSRLTIQNFHKKFSHIENLSVNEDDACN